jgi:hypothetical protein
MSYRDMTFCGFYKGCVNGNTCDRALWQDLLIRRSASRSHFQQTVKARKTMNNTAIPGNTLRYCNILDIMYMICYGITGIAVTMANTPQ